SDGQAVLPAGSSLSNGSGIFNVTLKTSGNRTVTATDSVNGSVTGTSGTIVVSGGAAVSFTVSSPSNATAGSAFSFTVTALDQFNNIATGSTAMVHFTSTDTNGTLPADSSLVNGTGTFAATLTTAGNRTITATDTETPAITGDSKPI